MGKKLTKAPVYYTVTQVQFNPVLNLGGFLPAIQDRMREANYPDYKPQMYQSLVLPFMVSGGGQAPSPSFTPQMRYLFGDIAGRTHFVLETNSLTLHSTAYDTFESFLDTFLRGLEIIQDSLRLAFVERIGLRYLDAVYPINERDALSAYLFPEVQGLSGKVPGNLTHSISETISQATSGQLVSRVIIRNGKIGFPENFTIQPPQIDLRFSQYEGLHAILDTDAFYMNREGFDIAQIQSREKSLHNLIREAFFSIVTPYALGKWA